MSGQSISLSKSRFCTSKNLHTNKRDFIHNTMDIPYTSSFGKYLDFPVNDGTFKSSDYNFILEKNTNKLQGWKANLLSLAIQKTIIQASSLPIVKCYAQCADLPRLYVTILMKSIRKIYGVALKRKSYIW